MKWIISLTSILVFLSACAPEADISHVEEDTEMIIFNTEEDTSISLSALMNNQSERPAENLTINWEIADDALMDMFSEPELVQESDGESFSIGGGERFMISETYFLDDVPDDMEALSGEIDGVVTNEDGDEVYRFSFEQIEEA